MKIINISREIFLKDRILGTLEIDGKYFVSGERIWLDNKRNISCIPIGSYHARKRYSKKYGNHIELLDVPNRSLILIHSMNFPPTQSQGCIGIGTALRDINNDGVLDIYNSKYALNELIKIIGEDDDIIVNITSNC